MSRTVTRLTDADLATVAEAPPELSTADLARQLGRPYFTVRMARRRIQQAGGWFCPLRQLTCAVCGHPLLAGPQREVHVGCERERIRRRAEARRRTHPEQKSTPYVRAWRGHNPEENATLREREKARMRERWPELPPEKRAAIEAIAHAAERRTYERTLELAEWSGTPWTGDDDQYLLDHWNDLARDVAAELGRTLYAIRHRKMRLRRAYPECRLP